MPTDDSLRLHKRQRIEGTWHQTVQPNKDQAIHGIEAQPLRQMPALDVELMTKDQDLSFQRGPRPEQQRQHRPDQAASFSHKTETLRDSASLASRIRFPTGSGGFSQSIDIKSIFSTLVGNPSLSATDFRQRRSPSKTSVF
jgi:hypothetical protein